MTWGAQIEMKGTRAEKARPSTQRLIERLPCCRIHSISITLATGPVAARDKFSISLGTPELSIKCVKWTGMSISERWPSLFPQRPYRQHAFQKAGPILRWSMRPSARLVLFWRLIRCLPLSGWEMKTLMEAFAQRGDDRPGASAATLSVRWLSRDGLCLTAVKIHSHWFCN